MTLVRFRPYREMEDIRHQMDRLFESMLTPAHYSEKNEFSFSPAIEWDESEDAFHVRLEVPGVNLDDLDIEASNESISIVGERRLKSSPASKGAAKSEFRYGKFQRMIPLPGHIDHQNIRAVHENGVVELTLPKAEAERNRVVKVDLTAKKS